MQVSKVFIVHKHKSICNLLDELNINYFYE